MERDDGKFKKQSDHHQNGTHQSRRVKEMNIPTDFHKEQTAPRAVDEADAIEEDSRGSGSYHEIFHRRFTGSRQIHAHPHHDVEGNGHKFKPHEGRQKIIRRGKDAHAHEGGEEQRVKFSAILQTLFHIIKREQHRKEDGQEEHLLKEQRVIVRDKQPGKESGTVPHMVSANSRG